MPQKYEREVNALPQGSPNEGEPEPNWSLREWTPHPLGREHPEQVLDSLGSQRAAPPVTETTTHLYSSAIVASRRRGVQVSFCGPPRGYGVVLGGAEAGCNKQRSRLVAVTLASHTGNSNPSILAF
jgi:hypothetical protein